MKTNSYPLLCRFEALSQKCGVPCARHLPGGMSALLFTGESQPSEVGVQGSHGAQVPGFLHRLHRRRGAPGMHIVAVPWGRPAGQLPAAGGVCAGDGTGGLSLSKMEWCECVQG